MIDTLKIGFLAMALAVSGIGYAAYNDVTIESGTLITVGGSEFTVFGTENALASLAITDSDMSVVLEEGSSFSIASMDKIVFEISPSENDNFNARAECLSSNSRLTLTGNGAATVTITPTGDTCRASGGGGGGGGGSSDNDDDNDDDKDVPETPTTPATPAAPGCLPGYMFSPVTGAPCGANAGSSNTTPATPASPGQGKAYAFGTILVKLGTKGEACKAWQQFLNDKMSSGLILDGWCGKLTIAAAKTWQASAGLTPDGLLGPMSRAKAMMQ